MDCFFAAVEMRDQPALRNVPLAVGGAEARGVICTANYLARSYGVKSAMSGAFARKLCPKLVFAPLRFFAYKEASAQVFEILAKYSNILEGLSLDEAYLDLSERCSSIEDARKLASQIKKEILQKTELTCSVGISYCKFLAKIASDYKKPDGLFVIDRFNFEQVILPLPLIRLPGVGSKTFDRLKSLGLRSIQDVKNLGSHKSLKLLGEQGLALYHYAVGIDDSVVESERESKSISVEETFAEDLYDIDEMKGALERLLPDFFTRIKKFRQEQDLEDQSFKTREIGSFFVKIKTSDFKSYVTVKSLPTHFFKNITDDLELNSEQRNLMLKLFLENREKSELPVRLLGIGVKIVEVDQSQLSLFASL
jgi:DNA polymerase IV